jgi:hypothetical protein
MNMNFILRLTVLLIFTGMITPAVGFGQIPKSFIKKYMDGLPSGKPASDGTLQKYRMTALYTEMDIFGNFKGKTLVTGDYTRGFKDGLVMWNNVIVSTSNNEKEPIPAGEKKDYMEGIKYVPSGDMVKKEAFSDFPATPDNIFARNVIWDMLSFEIFAWQYSDSLKLNRTYLIPDIHGQFDMGGIGQYSHNKILLTWVGISEINGELYAVIDFNAVDNKIELNIDMIKSKGTEQYWGTLMVSMKTKLISHGKMYSGTIQEIEVKGMKDKFYIKTIRELDISRIQ